ncbi:MAG: hypothetical protein H6Q89_2260 [Myxococcaceae bacterium]|nr:hypothetical protein [Myxococcaceae bacterium]
MRGLFLVLLCSCATVSTAGMSESCKKDYHACLNSCPEAPRQGAVSSNTVESRNFQTATAACTDACNQQSKKCK